MVDSVRTIMWQRFEEQIRAAVVCLLSACPLQSCHVSAIAWHIAPVLVYEGQHRPVRSVRLLQMLDARPDLFAIHVEPDGAVVVRLA